MLQHHVIVDVLWVAFSMPVTNKAATIVEQKEKHK